MGRRGGGAGAGAARGESALTAEPLLSTRGLRLPPATEQVEATGFQKRSTGANEENGEEFFVFLLPKTKVAMSAIAPAGRNVSLSEERGSAWPKTLQRNIANAVIVSA